MKQWVPYYFVFLFMTANTINAQPIVKTIIPETAVAVGKPFRIQFVVQNSNSKQRFSAPEFKGLKIIRGPEVYSGTQFIAGKKMEITNYVFTVLAERTGNYRLKAAFVKLNGLIYPGTEFLITVINRENFSKGIHQDKTLNNGDDFSGYILMRGEDPYKKIRENLFVKIFVDKHSCFVGEPIVATFKLFSRLQSKSDIIKNPGFYGFSVYDMISLDDKLKETERISGKVFDVHTIRKVQLYPLAPGRFYIDEMQIENNVEFSRSIVNKKTEQEISEGILHKKNEERPAQSLNPETEVVETEIYEIKLNTETVSITVNPLPEKNKPAEFNGATGDFKIIATLEKKELNKNEEGFLEIRIEGNGNFTQLTAPVIQWAKELEGFEPSVKDFIDKRYVPLSGSRVFRYPFISAMPGNWEIPAVKFSFFNKNRNAYQMIFTNSINIKVNNKEFKREEIAGNFEGEQKVSMETANRRASLIAFIIVALLVVGVVGYLIFRERNSRNEIAEIAVIEKQPMANDFFESVRQDETMPDAEFYTALHQSSWNYLTHLYTLSGTEMNKGFLTKIMEQKNEQVVIAETINLLIQLETIQFTKIELEENRQELIDKTIVILNAIKA